MTSSKSIKTSPFSLLTCIHHFLALLFSITHSYSQKPCPNCGSIQIPYPLSTNPACGDRNYHLRCDSQSHQLYFDAMNESSYLVLKINAPSQRIVVKPSPFVVSPPTSCVTQDMVVSEGIRLNQSLPFNITSSNTIFLFNCSPRLLVSPLNCTPSSLCHRFLDSDIDRGRAADCAGRLDLCCTFVAGGIPTAFRIRLHNSGCRAFRSVINLDPEVPEKEWEEGLEIQWTPPPEPRCNSQLDCSGSSRCFPESPNGNRNGPFRCICNRGYYWDHVRGICSKSKSHGGFGLGLKVSVGAISACLVILVVVIVVWWSRKGSNEQERIAKARGDLLKLSGKTARMFQLREVKKATNDFAKDRFLGSGGFGEVFKGELQNGTVVAVKAAKVGNIKSTEQVLNEVDILSQVNHKNLVKLLGCCVESEQPLMIYEYISNGTLHDHLHGVCSGSNSFLGWKTRLRIACQTAEALVYLHSEAYTPIFHRDVKSTNILLDEDFSAKVSDFGLSRLARPGLSHVSTCAQGTLGYLDPEYYRNYQLNDKSDVYSFGVVLLELLTSQKAIDFSREQDDVNLAIYVSQQARKGAILEVVDQKLLGENPSSNTITSLKLFAELALACLHEKKVDRPSMKDVVQQLESISQLVDQENDLNEIAVDTTVLNQ